MKQKVCKKNVSGVSFLSYTVNTMSHSPTSNSDFLHDVKNHVAVITAYTELLEMWKKSSRPSDAQFEKYINVLKERSQKLVKLVEEEK